MHSGWPPPGAVVTAVDFSEGMLAEARRKPGAEAIRFVVHDLHEPLPFTAEFDLVVSGLVLEHIRELNGFFCRGPPGASSRRSGGRLGDAPGDVPARQPGPVHRPGDR